MYDHLNLREWPFKVAPDSDSGAVWAGRPDTRQQLEKFLRKLAFTPNSNIHLLWANFGMGKTHTLYYIQHRCREQFSSLIPVYTVLPKRAVGFIDVYRSVAEGLTYDARLLYEQMRAISNHWHRHLSQNPIFSQAPDLVSVLLAATKEDPALVALSRQWLTAQSGISSNGLRQLGVSRRLRTVEDCIAALTTLTNLLTWAPSGSRKLVVMIDEFQRIGELKPKLSQEINAGLHTYFNGNPRGLELILTFSFGRQDNIRFLLSAELLSRAQPEAISLDVLKPDEAEAFVADLLAAYRIREPASPFEPFSPEAVRAIISHIHKIKTITPRRVMHYFDHVLLEHEFDETHEAGKVITASEVLRHLANPDLGALDIDQAD